MTQQLSRRTFLRRSAEITGGLTIAGPLQALAARAVLGAETRAEGYGELFDRGDLFLPRGFRYEIVSMEGDLMSDGNPTPGIFDGMAAFPGRRGTTILIRNHENRRREGETAVVVPDEDRYDSDTSYNAGNTKLVLTSSRDVVESFAILGGTSTNCAGGRMPWGAWVASEEVFDDGAVPHGYSFEIDAHARGPVPAIPIKGAGRLVHEAVAWWDGILYETEDRSDNACFYRYVPDQRISGAGDLARSTGKLQALKVVGHDNVVTDTAWIAALGEAVPVEWVDIADPDPDTDSVRDQAAGEGAALFDREEGMWAADGRIYFDCTSGGAAGEGQIWEYDPRASALTLVFESPGADVLKQPDNLVVMPTRDLLLCEDADFPQFLRGVTGDGRIYDFCRAKTFDSEFCGACFDPSGRILYVNQQGNRNEDGVKVPAVTFAIWGPWERRGRD